MIAKEIIAIVLGYLLGSTPSAYIAARLVTGKDIRQIGGGNVGGFNTFREVGAKAALFVGIVDVGKGAVAVSVAHWLLGVPPLFVMLAGLAAVVGHNWMVWLKFSGGKGMGATIGALAVLMPLHGYTYGFLIFLVTIIIPLVITRNVALSLGISLVFLPLIVWLGTQSGTATIVSIALGLLILFKFLPTAKAAWAKKADKRDFVFGRIRKHES